MRGFTDKMGEKDEMSLFFQDLIKTPHNKS